MEHRENPARNDRLQSPDVGLLLFALGLLTGIIAAGFYVSAKIKPPIIMLEQPMEYKDYISIILTATTVILAVLAVFIGALTVWGYSQFSSMVENSSREHIKVLLSEGLFFQRIQSIIIETTKSEIKDGELRDIISSELERLIVADAEERASTATITDEEFKD